MDGKLQLLQHSLGVDRYGDGVQFRNHFVAGLGSKDHTMCLELVDDGLMRLHKMSKTLTGGDECFVVTSKGVDFVALNSPMKPPEPKLTRSQKNYQDYLDADCGFSFREWMGFPRKVPAYERNFRFR